MGPKSAKSASYGILPILLISAPKQPQTRLRAQNLTISTEFSRERREEKRGCCREKRKGKQTGCERKTLYSLRVGPVRREGRSRTQRTGVGSASRHGGGLGRVHPHDRVPGIPLSYRTKLHPAARGQARASYWLRSPSSPAPDKGQRQARSTVDSLFHWRSLSTSDLPPASHQQSLTTTGTLTEAAKRLTWVAGR